jgi:hypothetical protein
LLLAALDAGLQVVTARLELAQNALGSELALKVLDRTLDAFIADGNFQRFTLDCFTGHTGSWFSCEGALLAMGQAKTQAIPALSTLF